MPTEVTVRELGAFFAAVCARSLEVKGDLSHYLQLLEAQVVLDWMTRGIRCSFPTKQILIIKSQTTSESPILV